MLALPTESPVEDARVTGSRVLVVDDEPQILRALRTSLRGAGYEVETADTAAAALAEAAMRPPDAVILDLVLPDGSGTDVCRELRTWSSAPVIVLSAVGDEREKIAALDAGADDYVTKPVGIDELLARLRAALRRASPSGEPVIQIGDLVVDLEKRMVALGGNDVHLTPHQFDILRTLARNEGKLMTHGDDVVEVVAGEVIPADGEVIDGVGSVDESAITGESAPVIRESGGDRSAVTGGTKLLSDKLVIRVTQEPGKSFLDRMIALVEGAERRKTPNEIALNILLAGLTITFLAAVVTLAPFAVYAGSPQSQTVLIALLVALIPTTIGALLSAIGIAGMDRLVQRNVLAMSGRAVEASGDVDVLLLDKTGTITLGNRQASEFVPVDGVDEEELAKVAQLASLADETPEGRSIVVLAKERYGLREQQLSTVETTFVPFSATTRMSGVDMNGNMLRKGAADAVKRFVEEQGGRSPAGLDEQVDRIARQGGTPLVVAQDNYVLGVIHLKDIVKGGMRERFDELRRMGITTVMITGDNRVTAAVIADEAGVDDFLAEATPRPRWR